MKKSVKEMLTDGYSPYDVTVVEDEVMTVSKALDYALSNKKVILDKDIYKSYELRVIQFKKYLKKRNLLNRDIGTFNFQVIREFLKQVAKKLVFQIEIIH